MIKSLIYLIFVCVFFSCCSKLEFKESTIVNDLDLTPISYEHYTKYLTNSTFNFYEDTLYKNIDLSWLELDSILKLNFKRIDSLQTDNDHKNLYKSSVLADLVFSLFGSQFLGNKIGLWDSIVAIEDFKKLSLPDKYRIVNSNELLLSCGEMAFFFKDLVESHLDIEVEVISIDKFHTFPLIKLSGNYYIMDPYDPVFLFSNNKLLSYDDLLTNSYNGLSIYRTSRMFGNSKGIVSKKFIDFLIGKYKRESFKELLNAFVLDNSKSILNSNALSCYELYFQDSIKFQLVHNQKAVYAIEQRVHMSRYPLSEEIIRRDYLGETCNSKK